MRSDANSRYTVLLGHMEGEHFCGNFIGKDVVGAGGFKFGCFFNSPMFCKAWLAYFYLTYTVFVNTICKGNLRGFEGRKIRISW